MNFKDRRTRRIAVASASAALVTAGGITAINALAAGETLAFGPVGTSATILGLNPTPATADGTLAAGLGYGLKVTGITTVSATDALKLSVVSGPAGGSVLMERRAGNGTPVNGVANWATVNVGGADVAVPGPWAVGDNVYLQSAAPGTYTVRLYQDHNNDGAYQSGQDDSTPVFTLKVLDVNAATATTTDDFAPALSVASSVDIGRKIRATIPPAGLTTLDTRGVNGSSVGVLGANIAAALNINENGAGLANVNAAPTFDGTNFVWTPGSAPTGAGTVISTPKLNLAAPISYTTASTTVNDNGTTALALATGTGQDTNVTGAAANVKVRPGTSSVTYTATATGAGAAKVAGATVWFTLAGTSGITLGDLTANGAAVPATGEVSAVTNASGVATLVVSSAKTANTNAYTVDAASNGHAGTQITATYQSAAPGSFKVTSTAADLAPVAGGTAQLKGQLLDQYGVSYQPAGPDPRQVSLFLGSDAATLSGANTATSTATTQMPLAGDGSFTYAYTPAAPATAGTQTHFTYAYDNNANGAFGAGEAGKDGVISWASPTAVATVAISAPTSSNAAPIALATAGAAPSAAVQTITGAVTDASTAGLAYKTITLTGSPGVYFASDNQGTGLVNSIQVTSNGAGVFTGYAVFTKPGAATITGTSEGKTVTVNEVIAAQVAGEKYNVTVNNVAALPNTTVIVSGKVTDVFGNPVAGVTPTLSIDDVTLGSLSASGASNATGDFSATYVAGSVSGKAKVTATITPVVLHANWLAVGGLTLPAAVGSASGTITIAPDAVAFSAPASRLGAGGAKLTGTARAGASVDIYVKRAGQPLSLIDSVTAGNDGTWSATETVSATTTFLAKTSTATSPAVTVRVVSTARISTKLGRRGALYVGVSGGPSRHGTVVLWQQVGRRLIRLGSAGTVSGSKTWVFHPGRGSKTFKATYTSSGCSASAVVGRTVRL